MKKLPYIYIVLLLTLPIKVLGQTTLSPQRGNMQGHQMDPNMQNMNSDSLQNDVEIISLAPKYYQWKVDPELGVITQIPADTVRHQFQNANLPEGMNGHKNHLGNLGSPALSRIFFERKETLPGIFLTPFSDFVKGPEDHRFTNSNIPYSNLEYHKAGGKVDGEERFKAYFSVNVNKALAFGFNFDYLYGRGFYNQQSTAYLRSGVFGSYITDRYKANLVFNAYTMKMAENGGVADDRYITDPVTMANGGREMEGRNIPTNLGNSNGAWNYNRTAFVFLTHRYNVGFYKEIYGDAPPADSQPMSAALPDSHNHAEQAHNHEHAGHEHDHAEHDDAEHEHNHAEHEHEAEAEHEHEATAETAAAPDSIPPVAGPPVLYREFIPVTSFIHTVKVDRAKHEFMSKNEPDGFFPTAIIFPTGNASHDSTTYVGVKNTLGIALLEGFNKYAKAGLTAFVSHKVSNYTLMTFDADRNDRYTEHEVYVGGELAKRSGRTLHYRAQGEVGIAGKAISQFNVKADADLNIALMGDTLTLTGRANISNRLPDFYMRHYHSNHYWWDNDNMDNEFRTRVEGELAFPKWGTTLSAGVENIKNYTYFNYEAKPVQYGSNMQVLTARLKQNFKWGILRWDNDVAWQRSSNVNILPLPDLTLYSNLYLSVKLAKKVLSLELGGDVRYFTEYYAPAYAPGIQQFHLQTNNVDERVKLGGYPVVNVYANFHLKQTRFFVMMTHVNQGSGNRMSFLAPHYPINQMLLRLGVSWNFYD